MISATDKIYSRIKRLGKGSAFVAKDFMDIANLGSVDVALSALVKAGTIRRILSSPECCQSPKVEKLISSLEADLALRDILVSVSAEDTTLNKSTSFYRAA